MPRRTSAADLVRKGYIKGIIGLPANLFYGTGIPACIVVIDKEDAQARKGIFMIDASQGFMKDGPKNRLRAQDIHKIVDAFTKRLEIPELLPHGRRSTRSRRTNSTSTCRATSTASRPRTSQDIEGPPARRHSASRTSTRSTAIGKSAQNSARRSFKPNRSGYRQPGRGEGGNQVHHLRASRIRCLHRGHERSISTPGGQKSAKSLKALKAGCHPKQVIVELSESLLAHYTGQPLIDPYDIYQHLMDYWAETMQDDCYLIAADGWKAETYRIIETDKKGKEKDKGWTCDLIPKVADRRPILRQGTGALSMQLTADLEADRRQTRRTGRGARRRRRGFRELDKVNKGNVTARLKEIKGDKESTPTKPPC